MRLRLRWVAAGTVLLAACSIVDTTTAPPSTRSIAVYNYFFYPAHDSIFALDGDTIGVEFVWTDGSDNHQVFWNDGNPTQLRGSELQNVGTFDVTLVPGVYDYYCSQHGASLNMIGEIVVRPHPTE